MTAGETVPSTRTHEWLVPRAARSIPIAPVIAIPLFGAAYFIVAMLHPLVGGSPLSVMILTLLAMLTFGYALLAPNGDILDPMRVVSVYYLVIFCVSPLAAEGVYWHYTRHFHELLLGPAVYCFFAFVMFVVGYHFPTFARIPPRIAHKRGANDPAIAGAMGLAIWFVGFVSWLVLVAMAGGVEGLVYSEKSRGEFFYGFGYFFFGAILMYPGAVLYWSSRVERSSRLPWAHAWILVLTFTCFIVLQGRMRAINILILGLFAAHYLHRALRPSRLAIFGSAGLVLALVIGVARAPSTRAWAFSNPTAILADIFSNLEPIVRGFLVGDFSRLRQIVLIMDKVPAWMPYDWGRSLLMFANPWVRLAGFPELQTPGIGPRLFQLAHPDFPEMTTGYLPSLLGEMIVNFPWFIAIFAFVPFGMWLRWTYMALIVRRGSFIGVALYSVLLLQLANMLLQSLGHVIFELFIVSVPIVIVGKLSRRQPALRVSEEPPASHASRVT